MRPLFFVTTTLGLLLLGSPQAQAQSINGIWIDPSVLLSRPTSGSAWTSLQRAADQTCRTPNLSDQDDTANICVMAKALVFARTRQPRYRQQVVDSLSRMVNDIINNGYRGRALALGRELAAYVIAADLVGLQSFDPGLDQLFRKTIASLLTTPTTDGPRNLIECHEDRPNNWGTHCGASRAAVAAYLGDTAQLARVAQVFRGWLGSRSSYSGFRYGDGAWQCDASRPVGINPAGCTKNGHSIDGVLPDDQRRAGGFTWPPPKENYAYESLQGALVQAIILQRAGYDAFGWENRALLRAFRWLHAQASYPAEGDDTWQPHVVNHFYGSAAGFPAPVPSRPGKNVGWTDWSHAGVTSTTVGSGSTSSTTSGGSSGGDTSGGSSGGTTSGGSSGTTSGGSSGGTTGGGSSGGDTSGGSSGGDTSGGSSGGDTSGGLSGGTSSGGSAAATTGIWISAAELRQRPMSGTAWTSVLRAADRSCGTPNLSDQEDGANVCVLAKAIVFARTGTGSYRSGVVSALQSIANSGTYSGRALALGRELAAYVIAADLVDLKTFDSSLDSRFRTKIRSLLTTRTTDGPTSLVDCHERRPNNWGTHCGASRAAVAAYLGDTTQLARVAQVFRGWVGNRSSYSGFSYGDLAWQCNSSQPVGINPAGCTRSGRSIDGVIADDQRRAGGFTWPPPKENYAYEALQGAVVQALILQRAGYAAFDWENRAILRAFQWLHSQANYPADGDDTWQPHLVNRVYGTNFPAPTPSRPGKNMGWTDWTHGR